MTLKKYILIFFTLLTGISTRVHAQYVDTVCTGDAGVIYGIERGDTDSYIQWFIAGGSIITDYEDSIVVDWGNTGGVFTIKAVEISLAGCQGDTVYASVRIIPPPDVNIGTDAAICAGETYEIDAGGGFTSYLWQDGSIDRRYYANLTGEYRVMVTNEFGCINSDSLLLTVNPLPYVNLGADTVLCNTEGLVLDAGDGPFYTWSNGATTQTIRVYPGVDIYSVEVVNEQGCEASDTITILNCGNEFNLVIPTIITPNGDEKNDTWVIEGIERFPDVTVRVFSRWGNRVFESTGYNEDVAWDGTSKGKDLPMDSYYYIIDLHNGAKAFVGTITIVR